MTLGNNAFGTLGYGNLCGRTVTEMFAQVHFLLDGALVVFDHRHNGAPGTFTKNLIL